MAFGIQSIQNQNSPFATSQNTNSPFANLDLTTQQQQQVQQIFGQVQSGSLTPSQAQSQIQSLLSPQQQQTLQTDKSAHHGRHHAGDSSSSSSSDPLSMLDLTSSQQSQIGQIINEGQANGSSTSDVLSQIDGVLTANQQQQLVSLFSSSAAYTSTGASTGTTTPSYVVNTTA